MEDMNEMIEPFRTTDLQLASFLFLKKLDFQGLEKKDQRSFWFLFSPATKCHRLSNDFFSGKGQVSPRDYADSLRRTRDLLFEAERGKTS